jgi:heme exporter protein A
VKPLLRFDGVSCVRGGRLLFEEVSFALGPGEALHISGPNGSGKSSLIRLAAGLLKPAAGKVEREQAALADDSLAMDREQPLIDTLAFWLGRGGDRKRLETALQTLDLDALVSVPVRLLSTGQRKRATLARVAASDAPLWLLDEPLNGLDAQGFEDFSELIDAHTASGGAVVAASHLELPGEWRQLVLEQ